jgi:exonuclease SbcC
MKVITLKLLTIINFKGIQKLIVPFEQSTRISGDNATGKTTVFDAFTWLLFGKDSADRKDFEIKRLDQTGKPIEKTECEVSAEIEVNGKPIVLKRIFREKWVKKRGGLTPEFTGNEQVFFYNDVPLQAGEYQDKINAILEESIFKLITNTLYFNTLNWKDRRKVLMEMAGDISNESLAAQQKRFLPLVNILDDKSLDEYKAELASKKKKLKAELDLIPTRIDELRRSMPDVLPWTELKSEKYLAEVDLNSIDEAIADRSKKYEQEFKKIEEHQRQVHQLISKKDALYYELKGEYDRRNEQAGRGLQTKQSELLQLQRVRTDHVNRSASLARSIAELAPHIADKRSEWNSINEQSISFDEHEFKCPSCNRPLEAADIESKKKEIEKNFISNKTLKLNSIQQEGMRLKAKLDSLNAQVTETNEQTSSVDKQIETVTAEIQLLQSSKTQPIETFTSILETNPQYQALLTQIEDMKLSVPQINKPDNTEDLFRKKELVATLDELKKKLGTKDQIDRANERIRDLEEEQRNFSQQMADIEKSEFLVTEFSKAKMEMVEERINGKFQYVTFKLYNTLINGGEEEACEAMVDGVPFSNLNTAGRINAGIDIINALCNHYEVYAPIFIDNRESVTRLLESRSQVVNLIVMPGQQLLMVA